MTMEKVNSYLARNRGSGPKKNLDRMQELLKRLTNPQKNLNYIHITGSNGKGSTAAMFQSILREAGLKVGLFTSPHLETINERIRINDTFIKDSELNRLVNKIEPVVLELEAELEDNFFAFELLTAVSFLYFQEKNPDMVILEVGIGGRLDATNIIEKSELAVITSIGMDHTKTLGRTKKAILKEKIQILKRKGQMVVGPIEEDLKNIALNWAKKTSGEIRFVDEKNIKMHQQKTDAQIFSYKAYPNIELAFLGKHQLENASIVIEGINILKEKSYPITDQNIYTG
ncbi:MAG: bifunctional folylpolyglutamate synthase/dihydrofolate synthase, partial [Atopostipes suicloacalis]|nr:bifunctional folylpolyglutamate synthase/dihydrofolate synthase [Atopostipes suicloacalis]